MKELFFSLLFAAFSMSLAAQSYSRVRISLANEDLTKLAALGIEADHGMLEKGRSLVTDLSSEEIDLVRTAGFECEVVIEDVKKWYVEQNQQPIAPQSKVISPCAATVKKKRSYPTPSNYTVGSMGGYPTYAEILGELDEMQQKYPHLITTRTPISDTILTHEQRQVWSVKISDFPLLEEQEPEALYTALHHSREPVSVTQMLFFMWYLLENYDSKPEIKYLVDHTALYFIPCLNPDGYLYNEQTDPLGGGLWRKNRRLNSNGTYGVDLNRNYGFQWGVDDVGSSPNPNSAVYRGPGPFSEPETRMVRDFCNARQFKLALNYHAFGNLLIYPWSYSDAVADPSLPYLGGLLVKENGFRQGTPTQTVGYNVNGSSDDWMFEALSALSYTPETGPGSFGFWPPADTIDGLNKATQWSNLALGWSLLRLGIATDLSGEELQSGINVLPVQLQRFGFESGEVEVALSVLSSEVVSVSPASIPVDLAFGQDTVVYFTVEMAANAPSNTLIPVEIAVDNGGFTLRDTVEKVLVDGTRVSLYSESFETASNWTGDWGITSEYFVSPPTSFTDSPFSDYPNNSEISTVLTAPITVPEGVLRPRVEMEARWEIEANYDWLVIEAIDIQTGAATPLCGRFSHLGSPFQPPSTPLWDGVQNQWVKESLVLDDFIGKTIQLRFTLYSDAEIMADGFYFDDLELTAVTSASAYQLPLGTASSFHIQPNPVGDVLTVVMQGRTEQGKFIIFNSVGQEVYSSTSFAEGASSITVSTSSWPAGIYFYQWRGASSNISSARGIFLKK